MSSIGRTRVTPARVALAAAIVAALVFGCLWVGGAFDKAAPHRVGVQIGGALGTIYRIQGGPSGDTGPVSIPNTFTTVEFTTEEDVEDLRLLVTVTPAGGESANCVVNFDGKTVTLGREVPGSIDRVCRVGG